MNNYEAMFIIRPDLSLEQQNTLFNQLSDTVVKHNGKVSSKDIWAEKRKFNFMIKKYQEGTYYLMNFSITGPAIKDIGEAYKLNENILRVLITRVE